MEDLLLHNTITMMTMRVVEIRIKTITISSAAMESSVNPSQAKEGEKCQMKNSEKLLVKLCVSTPSAFIFSSSTFPFGLLQTLVLLQQSSYDLTVSFAHL